MYYGPQTKNLEPMNQEHWFWRLIRHPLFLLVVGGTGGLIGRYIFPSTPPAIVVNQQSEKELAQKDREIQALRGETRDLKSRLDRSIDEAKLDEKQYLERYSERLNDIEKRRRMEKIERIESNAAKGRVGPSADHDLVVIDKKYDDEKQLAENEKNRVLAKSQLEIERLRGGLKKAYATLK